MTQENVKKTRTSTLLDKLFKTSNLEEFLERNAKDLEIPLFHIYISELCRIMEQVPERVIKLASIERTYGHQLFNGTRKPSRDKVIQLAFGFGLDADETQELLKIAQKSLLYPKIKRDAVILYCLNNQKSIIETQSVLETLELTLLGGEERNG
jgi:hypothetical protein